MRARRLLLVDDDPAILQGLGAVLEQAGFSVEEATRGQQALESLASHAADLVLSDVRMPGLGGLELLDAVRVRHPGLPVILLTAFGDVELAMRAVRRGARDFLTKPVKREAVLAAIARALRTAESVDASLVQESGAMRGLVATLERIAGNGGSVLFEGETGAGKTRAARHLHLLDRPNTPLVELSCGAIPDALFEAELFGVAEHAFTDAGRGRPGALARVGLGTLLLDDVDALSARGQAALLRALSAGRFRRVGGTLEERFSGRVLATRARGRDDDAPEGNLRKDLYYRLSTFRLRLPSLRERPEDLPALLTHFLNQRARADGEPTPRLTPEACLEFSAHTWPGNVRELSAVATRLWLGKPRFIRSEDACLALADAGAAPEEIPPEVRVRGALKTAQGNKSEAARLLGISRGTLYNRLRELKLGC